MYQSNAAVVYGDNGYKMDILFYNSIKKAKKFYLIRTIYHLIKAAIFIIFLPIDISVLETTQDILLIFMGVAIGFSIFNLLINVAIMVFAYSDTEQNNISFLRYAQQLEHIVPSEPMDSQSQLKLQNCVSTIMYNNVTLTTIDSEGLTQQIKNTYEKMTSTYLQDLVMADSLCLSFFQSIGKLLGLAIIIYGIVALIQSKPSAAQLGVIITFLIFQTFHILLILLVLLGIALSPLLCILLCIALCCCSRANVGENGINMPAPVKATSKNIMDIEGSCPICYQTIKIDESIIILPCSTKHLFHEGCLNQWVRIRSTCPICRAQI